MGIIGSSLGDKFDLKAFLEELNPYILNNNSCGAVEQIVIQFLFPILIILGFLFLFEWILWLIIFYRGRMHSSFWFHSISLIIITTLILLAYAFNWFCYLTWS